VSVNRGEFTREVFGRLQFRIDGSTLAFGVAWAAFEGNDALNNPWSTTEDGFGGWDYNDVGVKNYPTLLDGIAATISTLLDSPYEHLRIVLGRRDSTIREILGALNSSPWGSTVTQTLWRDVVQNYDKYNLVVPGSNQGEVK
jgi:hypothetical protein